MMNLPAGSLHGAIRIGLFAVVLVEVSCENGLGDIVWIHIE